MSWLGRAYGGLTRFLTRLLFGESPTLRRAGLPGMPRPSRPWYLLAGGFMRLFFRLFARWERVGLENIPRCGGVILASNHVSSADPVLLAASIYPRWPKYMAKLELFQKRPLVGHLFALSGAFPVRRFGGDLAALRDAEAHLRRGEIVGMFPEGHRSDHAAMGEAYPGTALIALRSAAPVVPIAITGSERFRRGWRIILQRPRVRVVFGAPLQLTDERRGGGSRRQAIEDGSQRIMREIAALLPAEYRGVYHERLADLPAAAAVDR